MIASVQRQEPCARVAESDAVAMFDTRTFADTVIDDAELEPATLTRCRDHNVPRRGARRDAVTNRVLDERL